MKRLAFVKLSRNFRIRYIIICIAIISMIMLIRQIHANTQLKLHSKEHLKSSKQTFGKAQRYSDSQIKPLKKNVLFPSVIYAKNRNRISFHSSRSVVIGILSSTSNVCLREAQRKLFIPKAREYKRLDIKVLFLLDHRTPELDREQEINNDIVFLNSSVHGWNKGFAKKLHIWLRFVVAKFPEAFLVGRMDDDVFVCTPQIFDRLNAVANKLLYYGLPTGSLSNCPTQDCVDDMFLFLGIKVVRRIAKRNFCDVSSEEGIRNSLANSVNHGIGRGVPKAEEGCLRDGNVPQELRKWIARYDDIIFFDEREINVMIYFYGHWPVLEGKFSKYKTPKFCSQYVLYHKASVTDIYEMNRSNGFLLNDTSRSNISEQEIMNSKTCRNYSLS